MTPAQLRMALGSLEWSGGDLARMAHVEPAHVALFQRDHTARDVPPAAIKTLQEYLERLGFQFGDELAVRFSVASEPVLAATGAESNTALLIDGIHPTSLECANLAPFYANAINAVLP